MTSAAGGGTALPTWRRTRGYIDRGSRAGPAAVLENEVVRETLQR